MIIVCSIDAHHLETLISVEAYILTPWLKNPNMLNPHHTKTPPRHYEHHYCSIYVDQHIGLFCSGLSIS